MSAIFNKIVVAKGCETNNPWLLDGYKKFEDALESLKCVDYLDEKRTESAFFTLSKPETANLFAHKP